MLVRAPNTFARVRTVGRQERLAMVLLCPGVRVTHFFLVVDENFLQHTMRRLLQLPPIRLATTRPPRIGDAVHSFGSVLVETHLGTRRVVPGYPPTMAANWNVFSSGARFALQAHSGRIDCIRNRYATAAVTIYR